MDNHNSLVTVVVPVYNTKDFLDQCISSIVNQTFSNLELLLIDDGSTDGSSTICDEWAIKDKRIRVIHKKNEGAGATRNKGIKAAKGDYLLFVDSDDYIDLHLIEKCIDISKGASNCIVSYGVEYIDEKGNNLFEKIAVTEKELYEGRDITEEYLPNMIFSPEKQRVNLEITACMAHFYSMDVIKGSNWIFESEKKYYSEDLYSILKLFNYLDTVFVIKEALYKYRQVSGSLSNSERLLDYKSIRLFYDQCKALCLSNHYPKVVLDRISEPYLSFTIVCLKANMNIKTSIIKRYKEILAILEDPVLHSVIMERDLSYEKRKKRILYKSIIQKKYMLAFALIWAQCRKGD